MDTNKRIWEEMRDLADSLDSKLSAAQVTLILDAADTLETLSGYGKANSLTIQAVEAIRGGDACEA